VNSNLNRRVIVAAAVVMQTGLGSFYAWSVFREPLSSLYGASVSSVNVAFFLASLTFGISSFAAGLLMRRVDPRVIGALGGIFYGLGVFLASFAGESLPILYLSYGLIAGAGLGLGYVAPVVVLPRWFPNRPGLAYGIAVLGFGAGPTIGTPLATALISSTGSPLSAFGILGPAYAVVVGGAALLLKNPHDEHELRRRGAEQEGGKTGVATQEWNFRRALQTWQWYAMWVMFFLSTTAGLAVYSDARAMAVSMGGGTAPLASAFVVLMAVADMTGRLLWPTISDYTGARNVFLTMFLLQGAAFFLLPLLGSDSFVLFSVLFFLVLLCYGGGYGTIPALVDAYYGRGDIGTIYASIVIASGVAGFGAPVLLARSADATGSYDPALYATAGLMLIGAFIPLLLRPPGSPRQVEVGR
jgi:OFA family oxalate/formate antiporter-like MFS transporter